MSTTLDGNSMVSATQRLAPGSVEAALEVLVHRPERYRAADWPFEAPGFGSAGLYAWYVDDDGAEQLSAALGSRVDPGLIYLGQTGATLWPSGKPSKSTLAQRIGDNHIRGRVVRSTFRRTLAACLLDACSLKRAGPDELESASERTLSSWIRQHLSFSIYPTDDRDGLAAFEEKVLAAADPPLNLDGCSQTPVRKRLSDLRKVLARQGPLARDSSSAPRATRRAGRARLARVGARYAPARGLPTRDTEIDLVLQLPEVVRNLWKAQQALAQHYSDTGLRFTLDGRLVGDIAEALALEHFDLVLPKKRTGGVDALTKTGRTVQVKATGKDKSGPAFTPGEGSADYLLFFRIDFEANTASIAYNGPEAPIRAILPKEDWIGSKVIPLANILQLAKKVANEQGVPLKSAVKQARPDDRYTGT